MRRIECAECSRGAPRSMSIGFSRRLKYRMCETDRFDVMKSILRSSHIARPSSFSSRFLRSLHALSLFRRFTIFVGQEKRYARNEERSLVVGNPSRFIAGKTLHVANNKLIHPIEMKFCAPHILIQCNISFVIPPDILRTIFCFTI